MSETLKILGFIKDLTKSKQTQQDYEKELEFTDRLLSSLFPKQIAPYIREKHSNTNTLIYADDYKEVTILFIQVLGFSLLKKDAKNELEKLNLIFSRFDTMCDTYKAEKIKIIGDVYMAACGVPNRLD